MLGALMFIILISFFSLLMPIYVWFSKKQDEKIISEIWRDKNEMDRIQ
tara:strand:+ start:2284 stop:2427 length:144 start_codon:yes stop_codon:yes gene_type:complete